MRRMLTAAMIALSLFVVMPRMLAATPLDSSPRPQARPVKSTSTDPGLASRRAVDARFDKWINGFRRKALKQGISAQTFERAFRGVRYNAYVIEKDRNQAEFTKQIWEYLDTATSAERIRNGKKALARNKALLKKIERIYGVDYQIVLAIWGLESAYGARRGDIPVIEALATLAYDGRRSKFFETQLIAALQILESGDVRPADMKGSWAGAMGHTQFIPTSYLAFAQDLRGDGRRDIWSDNPEDALASTANYLARHGWKKGQPWGIEVKLPEGFDYSQTSERVKKTVPEWRKLGVKTAEGGRLPDHGISSILLPAGAKGAAFLIFSNFQVIERYNPADAYVIAVGHLGDRILGGKPIQQPWPRGEKALSFKQKKQMQRLLKRRGFGVKKIDGIVGPNTIAAIRAFQASIGVEPDGFATTDLLAQLKKR